MGDQRDYDAAGNDDERKKPRTEKLGAGAQRANDVHSMLEQPNAGCCGDAKQRGSKAKPDQATAADAILVSIRLVVLTWLMGTGHGVRFAITLRYSSTSAMDRQTARNGPAPCLDWRFVNKQQPALPVVWDTAEAPVYGAAIHGLPPLSSETGLY
ncbi:MAG: hypothetical protein R2844_07505 [Caldilineales bacterium]